MRSDYVGARRSIDVVKWVLFVLAGVFIFQMVLRNWFGAASYNPFLSFFALTPQGIERGFVQTLLTYGLLHETFFHIFFNGLLIFFIGRALQNRLGTGRWLELFFGGILIGGILWLGVQYLLPVRGAPLIGASAGAYALLGFFALQAWRESLTLYLYIIPIRLTGKQLFFAALILQGFFFVFTEIAPNAGVGGVAYSAHLGGLGFGWFYFQVLVRHATIPAFVEKLRSGSARKASASRGTPTGRYSVNLSGAKTPSKATRAEVDRILDKINSSGFGSLSAEEKATLDRAKDTLK
jgi:membrane associated rhomboid family serine protease